MTRKLTRHNGRSGKNGVYNAKHNDRRFDVGNSEHIDANRTKENLYWDCYGGLYRYADQDKHMSFDEVEKRFYEENYLDFTLAQNDRNEARRHPEKNRTPEDLRMDKRTCPEETIYQMGTIGDSESPETLRMITEEFLTKFNELFGEYVHVLDWALHLDEATPHIQERHVFDCKNKYGELAPQQEKALEMMGVPLPKPDEKKWKFNNRKMTFDAACRTMLFDICKAHGVYLDEEPEYGGRAYLEKQEYILMKQKEMMAKHERQIETKEAELEELTIRIEDTESFVEEVADTAYEKAVDVVTKTVQEEIRNEDFEIIADQRKNVLNDPKLTDSGRKFAGRIFTDLMKRFKGMTQHISERLASIFRSPEKKETIKEPIRESIRDRLAREKIRADAANERRWQERGRPKNKQQNKELD